MIARFTACLLLASLASGAFAAEKSADQTIKSLETSIVDLNSHGLYADAVPLAKQVIELRRKKSGAEDPDYASALANLALLDKSSGRFDEAQPLLEQSLAIRRKVLKPGDPLILASVGGLAEIYGDEGKPEQAEPLLKEAGDAATPEIANGAEAAGVAYLRQNRFEPAIPLLRQALDAYRKLYPAGNSKREAATANLAQAYGGAGQPDQVEPLLKQAADSFAPDDPAAVEALTRESDFYAAQKRPDEAAPILRRVVAIRHKLGNEDKNLATRVGNLAALYANSRRYADSVPLWQENIALSEKTAGPDSPSTAFGLDNLAIVYLNQADLDNAEPLLQRSAAIHLKAGGETDPHYVADEDHLAKIAERRKQLEPKSK